MFSGTDNIPRNILHIQSERMDYFTKYCQSHWTFVMDVIDITNLWNTVPVSKGKPKDVNM
jgi:hypothetical protein